MLHSFFRGRDSRPSIAASTPICSAVAAILAGEIGVDAAIEGLLSRPLKKE